MPSRLIASRQSADGIIDAPPFVDMRKRLKEAEQIDTSRALWNVAAPNS